MCRRLSLLVSPAIAQAGLSEPDHQDDRAVSGGRHHRPARAAWSPINSRAVSARPVIVENKPGAGTTLGAEQVARSEPDGYTLLMATSTTLAINKTLYKKLPYDPVKDFTPIALVAGVPFALIINPTLPAKTLAEFIAYAKSKPGNWPMARRAMAARSISARRC